MNITVEIHMAPPSELAEPFLPPSANSTSIYQHSINSTEFDNPLVTYNSSDVAEALRAAATALTTYAVPVICVLGIIGDVASFLIFVFSSFRYQPCSQYLAALAFVDTLFLTSQLINCLMTFFPKLALAPGYCSVMVYMSYCCSFLSAWFVVLMMTERYIVVCHPFRASAICNKKKSITVITALAVLSLVLYSHSFLTTSKSGGESPCTIDQEYYNFLIIFTYIDSVLVFVIPFVAIVLMNLRIIFTVRKFRLEHNLLNQSMRLSQRYHNADKTLSLAQVRSTKMLVWVSSVFIVLYLPSYAARLYGLILAEVRGGDMTAESHYRLQIAQQICQFLYYVNFAIDFMVYVMTSNNFRRSVSRCIKNIHMCKIKCRHRFRY